MKRTLSAMEARRKFGEMLEDVRRGDEVVIERAGKIMGVVISPERYQLIERRREEFWKTVDAMREMLFCEAAADPTIPGVIFTFLWALDLPEDTAAIERFADPFARSGGKIFFVELLARLNTRIAREGTAFRIGLKPSQRDVEAARARQIDAAAQHRMNTGGVLPLGYPHLVVDTESIDPPGAALHIKHTFAL